MDSLKTILDVCSGLLGLFLFCYIGGNVMWLYEKIRRKTPQPPPINPFSALRALVGKNDVVYMLAGLVLVAGFVNEIARINFTSNEIGAFYERKNYSESYEALIYPHDELSENIPCIVDLDKNSDEGRSTYTIYAVNFPFGKTSYVDRVYDPNSQEHYIGLGFFSIPCRIELVDIADENSRQQLKNCNIANYGQYCADKSSTLFHRTDCWRVTSIDTKSLVYFHSPREADVIGFMGCKDCEPLS